VIAAVPDDVPVILDAEVGDIGHTASAYARASYDQLGADAVTLNPYLGVDALKPFLERLTAARFCWPARRTRQPPRFRTWWPRAARSMSVSPGWPESGMAHTLEAAGW